MGRTGMPPPCRSPTGLVQCLGEVLSPEPPPAGTVTSILGCSTSACASSCLPLDKASRRASLDVPVGSKEGSASTSLATSCASCPTALHSKAYGSRKGTSLAIHRKLHYYMYRPLRRFKCDHWSIYFLFFLACAGAGAGALTRRASAPVEELADELADAACTHVATPE